MFGPFPANVSGNRVCDENVPVKVLQKENPVFTWPNRRGGDVGELVEECGCIWKDPGC